VVVALQDSAKRRQVEAEASTEVTRRGRRRQPRNQVPGYPLFVLTIVFLAACWL
jgi:hypothetical protein